MTTLNRTDIIFMVKITVILQIQLRRLKGSVSRTNPFKGLRLSALIFHERNKNCFLFTLIINYRIQFKWKLIWGTKWGLLLHKSTLCVIMIHVWKLDPVDENCIHLLLVSHNKIESKKYYELNYWPYILSYKQET